MVELIIYLALYRPIFMYANLIIRRMNITIVLVGSLRVRLLEGIGVELGRHRLFISRFASTRLRSPFFNVDILPLDAPSFCILFQARHFYTRQLFPSFGTQSSWTGRLVCLPLPIVVSRNRWRRAS
jgi:hypothetical protein